MIRAPIRLLVTCYHTRVIGGTETYLQQALATLAERVSALAVLTRSPVEPGTGGLVPQGVRWLSGVGRSPAELVGIAEGWNPQVVYTHGLGEPAFEEVLATRFPTVFYAHNYGGTCISGTKCNAFPSAAPCSRSLGPSCLAMYLPRRCGGLNPIAAVRQYRTELRRRRAFLQGKSVLTASRHMAGEMIRNGVPQGRVHHVPLPLTAAPDPFLPQPRSFTNRLLFVGRLTAVKGWSHLLAALPRASAELRRPLTLVVAGGGPDQAKFKADARRAGVSTDFLGWVGSDRREAETRDADLLVVPSVWPEPFGLVGIEAGCVGTPAVAYAVGGIPDWLEPGVSGESAAGEHPDPKQLAAAVVRALRDPDHWQRLRVGAWETSKRFSLDAHLDRLLPILHVAATGPPA